MAARARAAQRAEAVTHMRLRAWNQLAWLATA